MGLTFVHNEHGSYTYFSKFQATAGALLFMTCIPLSMLGGLLAQRKNVRGTVRWYAASFKWDQDDPHGVMKWAALAGAVAAPFFLYFAGPLILRALNARGFMLNLG